MNLRALNYTDFKTMVDTFGNRRNVITQDVVDNFQVIAFLDCPGNMPVLFGAEEKPGSFDTDFPNATVLTNVWQFAT